MSISNGKSISLKELAALCGGRVVGNENVVVSSIASLDVAKAGELTFLTGTKNFSDISESLKTNKKVTAFYGDDTPMDGNEDAIFGNISEALEGTDRSSDIDKYLKYENRNVSFMVNISRGTGEFEVVAVASDGEYIDDYPIPKVEHLDINESTGIATDEYHNRYSINWVE